MYKKIRTVFQVYRPSRSKDVPPHILGMNCKPISNVANLSASLQPTDPCPSLRVSPRRSRSRSRSYIKISSRDLQRSPEQGQHPADLSTCSRRSRRSRPSPPFSQVEEWPSKATLRRHCPVACPVIPVILSSLNQCSIPAVEPQEPQELDVAPGAFQLLGPLGRRQTSGVATGRTGITGACSNLLDFKIQLLDYKCRHLESNCHTLYNFYPFMCYMS